MGNEYQLCEFCKEEHVLIDATNVDIIPPKLFNKPICTICIEKLKTWLEEYYEWSIQ